MTRHKHETPEPPEEEQSVFGKPLKADKPEKPHALTHPANVPVEPAILGGLTIKSVAGLSIVTTDGTEGGDVTHACTNRRDLKVTLDGKPSTLSALKNGDHVALHAEGTPPVVMSIDATRDKETP